ncbi:hypothetical protein MBM_03078 [Drepanopeziza brunnea f. sp. 'multigermtubi' MB_m1]|uniref:Uncharacterized protein n=1 Tax=Marssonina brunnea f. sp. multigermtubi (strain MB_m1) TaxID=1072389 RepID=K1X0V3_MARBU|nr:uncharacterized protein MBM_03078 [Drepanopeziza brunnea f. sp. 'multigermtubi' MB_m1]EKD18836.1 hypothetical protein MBM_03078 [Drepanopeziza brunnea f. sp. 'multigermtubi' MB_m1]
MDSLPTEILGLILQWEVRMCERHKNTIVQHRLVCKAFDLALRAFAFKTVQLEFSRFLRHEATPDPDSLSSVGAICEAIHLDLMVVRDEEEISRLSSVFQGLLSKVPEMSPLLDSLRRYCMNENTFDETDFRTVVERVVWSTPNLRRLKLNLPFQVVGQTSRTATILLATTLACIARRPEEHITLETMVLDHVSDTSVVDICNNPMDVINAVRVFEGLKHLVLQIKRQETLQASQITFSDNLWFLIEKASHLESLCLIGWNVRRNIKTRRHCHNVAYNHWIMRSLPFHRDISSKLTHLRFLELKRVDIRARSFVSLMRQIAPSLKELYLNQVYLKVRAPHALPQGPDLWIGGVGRKGEEAFWIAEDLRASTELKLDILRVTGLGYDDFRAFPDPEYPTYDFEDPTSQNRCFDQRFVDAVIKGLDPFAPVVEPATPSPHGPPHDALPESVDLGGLLEHTQISSSGSDTARRRDWDAETFQSYHNPTSEFKRSLDGFFTNHNERALKELQNIITVADRGMMLLSAEIDRARDEGAIATQLAGNT